MSFRAFHKYKFPGKKQNNAMQTFQLRNLTLITNDTAKPIESSNDSEDEYDFNLDENSRDGDGLLSIGNGRLSLAGWLTTRSATASAGGILDNDDDTEDVGYTGPNANPSDIVAVRMENESKADEETVPKDERKTPAKRPNGMMENS